jgi:hypothetical protein
VKFLLFLAYPPAFVWLADNAPTAIDPTALLAQIGLGAVIAAPFLYLWRDERKQRQAADQKLIEVLEKQGPWVANAADTLERVQASMFNIVRNVQSAPSVAEPSNVDVILRRVESLASELREEIKQTRGDP